MATGLARYTKLDKLGEGTYGEVYRAKDKVTNEIVAMKRIKLTAEEEGIPPTALREISLLKDLAGHPNVVELKDVICEARQLYLVFEFVERDLKQYMDSLKELPSLDRVKSYLYQLLRGLDACHRRAIMHRDIKPQNVLVDSSGSLKLADFGLARSFVIPLRRYTHEVVTLWYRAPEVLLGQKVYQPGVDVWAVGCMFAELSNKEPLWRGDSEIDQLFKIFRTCGSPDETIWPGVTRLPDYSVSFPRWPAVPLRRVCKHLDDVGLDLLGKMLIYDPAKRISAKAAMAHPFFADLDVTKL